MTVRFGYVPLSSDLLDEGTADRLIAEYSGALGGLGGERWEPMAVSDAAPLMVLVLSGGTERRILDLWRRRSESAGREPVFLIAHPGGNSLPAALEALARLGQDGESGRILYLAGPHDEHGLSRVREAAQDLETRRLLRRARLGMIGSPSGWLVASSPDPAVVRETWGPHIVPVSLEKLTEAIQAAAGEGARALRESFVSSASEVREPSPGELEVAVHVSSAVEQLAERYRLTAVALRCFDLVDEFGTTGCLALSHLADKGVPAGCEGDVVSTVAMLWVKMLLNEPSWMANPARVDEGANTLVLAHCTVPRSMVREYTLRSHFETQSGVAIQGALPEGSVTLLRVGGKEMKELWIAEAEILGTGEDEDLCRTQTTTRLTRGDCIADLLRRPLGNHVVLVHGAHADRLRTWWEMMIAA